MTIFTVARFHLSIFNIKEIKKKFRENQQMKTIILLPINTQVATRFINS